MKRSMQEVGRVLLVVVALVVWMLSAVVNVNAGHTGSLGQQIQGNWVLVSIVNEQDGKKIDVFGPNPRGSFILTPDGRYSMILMRESLPKFASNARQKGTAEENQAVVQGSFAHFGRYAVESEKDKTLTLTIEGCTFPNFDGQTQKRIVTVQGDELRVIQPTPAIGSGTNYIVWKRAK